MSASHDASGMSDGITCTLISLIGSSGSGVFAGGTTKADNLINAAIRSRGSRHCNNWISSAASDSSAVTIAVRMFAVMRFGVPGKRPPVFLPFIYFRLFIRVTDSDIRVNRYQRSNKRAVCK